MTNEQLESAIALDVVTTFANLKEATPRRALLIKFRGLPAWQSIANLLNRSVLRRRDPNSATEDEQYLPTAAAFELCTNPQLREPAKLATTIVLHTLHQMSIGESRKDGFAFDDLKRHVERLCPNRIFDTTTLKLGLYLAKDFNVLTSYGPPDGTEITRFQIGEGAISMADPGTEWDRVMGRWLRPITVTEPPVESDILFSRDDASRSENAQVNSRDVFVIHGRDERLRAGMFEFLRSLGLNPMEWAHAVELTGKGAPYVGEVLDAAFSRAQAVVVLFTPDDLVKLRPELCGPKEPEHETSLTPQARPNVLFESGMAMARDPDRTILVEIGGLRPFSDVGGRHMVRMDNSPKKRNDLAARLKTAGCPINLTGTDWQTAGDMKAPEVHAEVGPVLTTGLRLSAEARQLLLAGSEDPGGTIMCVATLQGLVVGTNNRSFAGSDSPRSQARWKAAVGELVKLGFLEPFGEKGEVFLITHAGYEAAERIRQEQGGESTVEPTREFSMSLAAEGTPPSQTIKVAASTPIKIIRLEYMLSSGTCIVGEDVSLQGEAVGIPLNHDLVRRVWNVPRPDRNHYDHSGPAKMGVTVSIGGKVRQYVLPVHMENVMLNSTMYAKVVGSKTFHSE